MTTTTLTPRRFFKDIGRWIINVFSTALALIWSVPVIWALVASFRPANEPISRGDVWFGSTLTFENYAHAWSLAPFGQYYINTILIVLIILAVQLVTIVLAGFAFANYKFIGKRWIFFFVLLQMMIPTSALLAPNFATIRWIIRYPSRHRHPLFWLCIWHIFDVASLPLGAA